MLKRTKTYYLLIVIILLFDFLKQCPDINPNPGQAGRPSYKVEINIRNPLTEIETIKDFVHNKTSSKC